MPCETLIKGAARLLTMDDADLRLDGDDVRIKDGVIAEVGVGLEPGPGGDVLNAEGCLVTPSLVNTHHHLLSLIHI